jgi:hypothetical protein
MRLTKKQRDARREMIAYMVTHEAFASSYVDELNALDNIDALERDLNAAVTLALAKAAALGERVKQTRTAWFEQHGVPISIKFVHFANAIDDLLALLSTSGTAALAKHDGVKAGMSNLDAAVELRTREAAELAMDQCGCASSNPKRCEFSRRILALLGTSGTAALAKHDAELWDSLKEETGTLHNEMKLAFGELWGRAEFDCGPIDFKWMVEKSIEALRNNKQVADAILTELELAIERISEAFQRREPSANKWLEQFQIARIAIRNRAAASQAPPAASGQKGG